MEFPDFFKIKFNENVNKDLTEFANLAKTSSVSNKYCNIPEYNNLSKLFGLENLIVENSSDSCIDLCEISDEDTADKPKTVPNDELLNFTQNNSKNSFLQENNIKNCEPNVIKEAAELLIEEKILSSCVIEELAELNDFLLKQAFSYFCKELFAEQITNLWISINTHRIAKTKILVVNFIRYVILPKMKQELLFRYGTIFQEISEMFGEELRDELEKELLSINKKMENNEDFSIFLNYVGNLDADYKAALLQDFITSIKNLHPTDLEIIAILLNPSSSELLDDNLSIKLINIFAQSSTEYTDDKNYGKVLDQILNLTKKIIPSLEQPLNYILGTHKSVWRIKIEKIISSWFSDTNLTQSFI